jgi:hypothetical protein
MKYRQSPQVVGPVSTTTIDSRLWDDLEKLRRVFTTTTNAYSSVRRKALRFQDQSCEQAVRYHITIAS